jgi:hypothetical protein
MEQSIGILWTARRATRSAALAAVGALALLLGGLATASPALASGVWWHLSSSSAPRNLVPGKEGQIEIDASNLGYEEAKASEAHPLKLSFAVPPGLQIVHESLKAFSARGGRASASLKCEEGAVVSCTLPRGLPPYGGIEMIANVTVTATEPEAPKEVSGSITLEGGEGVATDSIEGRLEISAAETRFGVEAYELKPETDEGLPDNQAGSHPFQLTTTFDMNQVLAFDPKKGFNEVSNPALARNLHFVLPPGLLGNVNIVKQCSAVDFATIGEGDINACPEDTALGVARVTIYEPNTFGVLTETVPIFNLEPAPGEPARFGIEVAKVPITLTTAVRTGSTYDVEVTASDTTEAAALLQSQITFWGVPGDARHNAARGWQCIDGEQYAPDTHEKCQAESTSEPPAFITLPTSCSTSSTTTTTGESWPSGDGRQVFRFGRGTENEEEDSASLPALESGSCALLGFAPQLEVKTDSESASTPTGMTVNVKVPQTGTLSPTGLAEADVQDTKLELPQGVQASPAAAGGLLACSAGSFGFTGEEEGHPLPEATQLENDHFSPAGIACPGQAKIGTLEIHTPLLKHSLSGSVYLASQDTNPFGSPLVLYLFAEEPESAVKVKLAGEVKINEATGQLTSEFKDTPPVPFEELSLHLFGGGRASQSTPPLCGEYPSKASFTPDTASAGGAPAEREASFSITTGAGGGPCPSSPLSFAPSVSAGPTSNQAGGFTDFTITIGHPDGDQAISGLEVHLPEGAAAMLSSLTPCPIAQADVDACGPESLVGSATSVTGLGNEPFSLSGEAYLTEGLDGAPFGLSVAINAEHAGPFNLGTIISNSTIRVNASTAAVTVTAAESMELEAGQPPKPLAGSAIPTIIKGVPVQLKELNVDVNRPNFEFNPTNCATPPITGAVSGEEGASSPFSQPYVVDNCAALPFAPSLTTSSGSTESKLYGTGFVVRVAQKPGEANIAKTKLVLPIQLPSRLSTLQKACLAATFEANPASCDEGSLIGEGIARTPVLKNPLRGPVYLVSHGGAEFPDVEFVLQGEGIELILDGHTNIHHGITSSTFESVPDDPVSTFEAILSQGPHSALTVYLPNKEKSLCEDRLTVPTTITGQNGVVIERQTPLEHPACIQVLNFKETNARKLKKALAACKAKYKKNKKKRQACEAAARKKYGPKPKKKARKKKK